MIRVHNIHKSFTRDNNTIKVLEDLSFFVKRAEIVAILGPSGCGKTSLLRTLSGLDLDYTGEITRVLPVQAASLSCKSLI